MNILIKEKFLGLLNEKDKDYGRVFCETQIFIWYYDELLKKENQEEEREEEDNDNE